MTMIFVPKNRTIVAYIQNLHVTCQTDRYFAGVDKKCFLRSFVSIAGRMCADLRRKGSNVSCLKVHGSRAGKSAGQAFSGTNSGNYTS